MIRISVVPNTKPQSSISDFAIRNLPMLLTPPAVVVNTTKRGFSLLWRQTAREAVLGLLAGMFGIGSHVRAHASITDIVSTVDKSITKGAEQHISTYSFILLVASRLLKQTLHRYLTLLAWLTFSCDLSSLPAALAALRARFWAAYIVQKFSVRLGSVIYSGCWSGITFAPCF